MYIFPIFLFKYLYLFVLVSTKDINCHINRIQKWPKYTYVTPKRTIVRTIYVMINKKMAIIYNVLNKDEMRTKFLRNLNNVFVLYLPFYIFTTLKNLIFLWHFFVLTISIKIVSHLLLKLFDKIHQKWNT